MAANTKATMRVPAMRTPQDAAATRPPRSARMARPVRLSSRLRVTSSASTTATPITVK